jgi:peptidyl-prolyl cis-trans isomerase C
MARSFSRALAFAAGVSLAALAAPAFAQSGPEIDPNTVVARVNGFEITMEQVERMRARDPQLMQVPLPMLYESILNHLIEGQLIAEKAKAEGFADHPDVAERLNAVRDEIIRSVYLTRMVEDAATEEAIQARYEAFKAEHPPEEEVKASHILVETEEEARALIEQLEDGADFAELAKAESTGPSAPNGGDLGYFRRNGQMVEPFAAAAFDLEAGAFTTEPVQTQFGWHVITVTDRRMAEQPSLEQVRNQLTTEIAQDTIESLVEDLRAEAEIETTPIEDVVPKAEAE